MAHNRLIIFTRFPEPGKTKTRLIGALGADGAARLQARMTSKIISVARGLAKKFPVDIEVRFEGGSVETMRKMFGGGLSYRPQGAGDIGRLMSRALSEALVGRTNAAVLVGSDAPGVDASIIEKAFEALRRSDAVFGPAADGGYYLVGLKKPCPSLFSDISWSASKVLDETLERARSAALSVELVDKLRDVDEPQDVAVWEEIIARSRSISVVVVSLNDAASIEAALAVPLVADGVEVIVADGKSSDGTRDIAASMGARVIEAKRGRGRQMNAGAREASGEVICFLHADSVLPEGFEWELREIISDASVALGAFSFKTDADVRGMSLAERVVNLRSRMLGMPYGDQGFFVRADDFREVGGFPEIPIMEDFELAGRMRRRGAVAISDLAVVTSGQRWVTYGVTLSTLTNQAIIAGYLLGVSPARLRRWYGRKPARAE